MTKHLRTTQSLRVYLISSSWKNSHMVDHFGLIWFMRVFGTLAAHPCLDQGSSSPWSHTAQLKSDDLRGESREEKVLASSLQHLLWKSDFSDKRLTTAIPTIVPLVDTMTFQRQKLFFITLCTGVNQAMLCYLPNLSTLFTAGPFHCLA